MLCRTDVLMSDVLMIMIPSAFWFSFLFLILDTAEVHFILESFIWVLLYERQNVLQCHFNIFHRTTSTRVKNDLYCLRIATRYEPFKIISLVYPSKRVTLSFLTPKYIVTSTHKKHHQSHFEQNRRRVCCALQNTRNETWHNFHIIFIECYEAGAFVCSTPKIAGEISHFCARSLYASCNERAHFMQIVIQTVTESSASLSFDKSRGVRWRGWFVYCRWLQPLFRAYT